MANPVCDLCGKVSSTMKGLGQHVNRSHGLEAEEYASRFFVRPVCQCGSPTKFLSITLGYDTWCSACETARRSDSAKKMRARLKSDTTKYESFVSKLSQVIGEQWATIDQSARIELMLKNSRNGKWHGDVHSDDVDSFMVVNKYKAPWTEADLNDIFEVTSWQQ
jgi:hypothetical protein